VFCILLDGAADDGRGRSNLSEGRWMEEKPQLGGFQEYCRHMAVLSALDEFWDMRDLADALDELAERERAGEPNYPMCCLFLYAGARGPDAIVSDYVREAYSYLDMLTGDDCLVFVSHLHGDGSVAIEVAKALDVALDEMPCCVFFAPGADRKRTIVPIAQLVTDRGMDGLEVLLRAITQASRDASHIPAEDRVDRLSEALERKLARRYGTKRGAPARSNPISKVSDGANIVAALIAAAAFFGFGGSH
jgi:hypothetical protein